MVGFWLIFGLSVSGFSQETDITLEEDEPATIRLPFAVEMKLDRSASYVIDMATGLPISGKITSEVFFEGGSESQIIEFTSTY